MKYNVVEIKNNDDWNNLSKLKDINEKIVVISNNSYFGFRAMELNVKAIVYNPLLIDSLSRVCKESIKFPNVTHVLEFTDDTIGYDEKSDDEKFLKEVTRVVEKILEINPKLKIDFNIKTQNNSYSIRETLMKIYN